MLERRTSASLGILAVIAIASGYFAVAAVMAQGVSAMPYVTLAAGFIVLAWLSSASSVERWPKRRIAHVILDARGVWIGGRLRRERARMNNAYLRRLADGTLAVHLSSRLASPLELCVKDEAEGEQLLRALRLDATQSTATFVAIDGGSTRRMQSVLVPTIAMLALSTSFVAVMLMLHRKEVLRATGPYANLAFFAWLWWSIALARRAKVVVGSDGILVRRSLRRNRYVPFAEVDAVNVDGGEVVVTRRSGTPLRFGMERTQSSSWLHSADGLARRIEQARLRRAAFEAPSQALVARGDRSAREWLEALGALGDETRASYRGATVPRDALWHAIEDVAAAPDVRAGAAVALRGRLDGVERERLRLAADACASPRLRVALAAVGRAEDDDAIEQALEGLGEAERGRAQRVSPFRNRR